MIKTRTTTIKTTASVQYKGHGTHAMEPKTPYEASAPKKNVTNVSRRSLWNYEPNYWYHLAVERLTFVGDRNGSHVSACLQ